MNVGYRDVKKGLVCLLGLVLSGCVGAEPVPVWKLAVAGDGPGNPALLRDYQIKVSNLPKSRSGNRASYEVFGTRYAVLDSAAAFSETGTASWYGKKFHGRPTASGEIYDMHKFTAAHKHLPLPTFVRVTRVDDGRSIVVKVNDRGPFVEDRIIDLSYAAAARLGMLEEGKAEVHIEALSQHTQDAETTGSDLAAKAAPVEAPASAQAQASAQPQGEYIQAGAFGSSDNAQAFVRSIEKLSDFPVSADFAAEQQLYRVHIGPLTDAEQIVQTMQTLSDNGINGYVVTLPQ